MAVVPTDEIPTQQQEPLPGRAFPRFSDEASPTEFGYGVGAGLESAAKDFQKVTNQANELAVTKAHTALLDKANDLQFNPDNGAFTKQGENAINLNGTYGPQLQDATNQLTAGLANPAQRSAFQQLAAREAVSFKLNLERHEGEQQKIAAKEILTNSIDALAKDAEAHYTDANLVEDRKQKIAEKVQALTDLLGVSTSKDGTPTEYGANILSGINERIDGNVARGMVDRDPVAALKQLMLPDGPTDPALKNGIKDARQKEELFTRAKAGAADVYSRSVIAIYRQFGPEAGAKAEQDIDKDQSINADVKEMAYGKIDVGLSHYQREQQQVYAKDFERVHENYGAGVGSQDDINTVRDLVNHGAMSASAGGTLIGGIRSQMAANDEDESWKTYVKGAYDNGIKLDPKGNPKALKALDSLFQQQVKDEGLKPLSDPWINRATLILERTGVLPKSAIETVRGTYIGSLDANGDAEAGGQAAIAVRRFEQENHHAVDFDLDDKTKAALDVATNQIEAGVPKATAIQTARTLANMPETTKKYLEETWKATPAKDERHANLAALNTALKGDSRFDTGTFTAAATIPPDLAGAYERAVHDNFIGNGGRLDAAQDTAIKGITKNWGVTYANGPAQIMKYAPEAMDPKLTTNALKDSMATFARTYNQTPVPTTGMVQEGNIKPYDAAAFNSKPIWYPEEAGGKAHVIPTVIDGKQLTGAEAITASRNGGKTFGTFDSEASARAFLDKMKDSHEKIQSNTAPVDPANVVLVPAPGLTETSQGKKWYMGKKTQYGPEILLDEKGKPVEYQIPDSKVTSQLEDTAKGDQGMRLLHLQREYEAHREFNAAVAAVP